MWLRAFWRFLIALRLRLRVGLRRKEGFLGNHYRRPEGLLHPVSSDNLEFAAAFLADFLLDIKANKW
jgi:hypothetical protein